MDSHALQTETQTNTPAKAGDFFCRTTIFNESQLARAIKRLSHEIVERNNGAADLVLVGLYTRGVALAERFAKVIGQIEGIQTGTGTLDVSFHRDDHALRWNNPSGPTEVPEITDKVVILVDDVLFTGRTTRAALEALNELGRPQAIQLAILIDRGHRELPIRADFVGKNLPTALKEEVRVKLVGVDDVDHDSVEIWAPNEGDS